MPLNIIRLRQLIAGRTHGAVAASAGMKRPNLLRILRGQQNPTIKTMERLARALGCHVTDLLDERE